MTQPTTFRRSLPRVIARITWIVALAASAFCLPAGAQVIPLNSEFQANQDTSVCPVIPRVFARADGGFGVVWGSQTVDSIRGRFYDADGFPETSEVTLQTAASGLLMQDAEQASAGGFVVLWTEFVGGGGLTEGGGQQLRGRRFSSDGTGVGTTFDVSAATDFVGIARLDVDEAGDFVVAWDGGDPGYRGVHARRFASDGSAVGAEFTVASGASLSAPDVAKDPDSGEFVVSWYDQSGDADVWARKYDSAGTPAGSAFVVNGYTTGSQRFPQVSLSASGEMMVSWSGATPTSSGVERAVLATFDAAGIPQGEFEVGDPTTQQARPSLAASPDLGSFAVGWEELTEVPGGGGVLTADVRAAFNILFDQQVTSTEAGEQTFVATAIDPAERATMVWLTDPDGNLCADVVGIRGQLYRELPVGDTAGRVHSAAQQQGWKYYIFAPIEPGGYEIKLTGLSGDADLYVISADIPTTSSWDCRSFAGGIQDEVCLVSHDGSTPLGVGVNGYQVGTTAFTLSAGPETPLFADGFESGDTSAWSAVVN